MAFLKILRLNITGMEWLHQSHSPLGIKIFIILVDQRHLVGQQKILMEDRLRLQWQALKQLGS